MAVPTGATATKFADEDHTLQTRVVVGLSIPRWTGAVTDTFGSLDETRWWHTEPAPEIAGSNLNLKAYGGPPFEVMVSTPDWFPTIDITLGFTVEVNATFPLTNPGYTILFALGSLGGGRGKVADPMKVIQLGENYPIPSGDSIGDIRIEEALGTDHTFANDQATHEYIYEWDPDGGASGGGQATIKLDGVTKLGPSDNDDFTEPGGFVDEEWIVRPYFIVIGVVAEFDDDVTTSIGTPASGTNILQVHDVTVTQLGAEGFESTVERGWTSANAGGNLDTAAVGERFDLDNETWAWAPNIKSWSVRRGRERASDTFSVTFLGPDGDDPDTTQNIFQGDHWLGRPILIDARVGDGSASPVFTAWFRLIAGTIEQVSTGISADGEVVITVTGRDRASAKLDTELWRSYVNTVATGDNDMVNTGFTIDAILQDIVATADASWDADNLGDTDISIQGSPDMTPEALSAGPNLLSAFTSVCDEIAMEVFRRYTVTGTGRYGEIVANKWTIGDELDSSATKFTLSGQNASAVTNVLGVRLEEDLQQGVGQVVIHADNMLQTAALLSGGEPGPGDFPRTPYPPRARELHLSLAESGITIGLPLFEYDDQDGDLFRGGTGKIAWFRENANRRRARVTLRDAIWAEPTDEFLIDDPEITGLTTAEGWVLSNVTFEYADAAVTVSLDLVTADVLGAVRRGL